MADSSLDTREIDRKAGRKFGLTVGTAFLAITAILVWRDRQTASIVAGSLGGLLLLGGLFVPAQMRPVEAAWMKMAHAISKVTTPIFMAIIYFVVITPAGVLLRGFGHRPLVTPAGGSAWSTRAEGHRRSSLERQF